jgi:hypothetical protein
MGIQRWWNAREPGQRTRVGRRQRREPPVEDGGHVARGSEVASADSCQHVTDWVLSTLKTVWKQLLKERLDALLGRAFKPSDNVLELNTWERQ